MSLKPSNFSIAIIVSSVIAFPISKSHADLIQPTITKYACNITKLNSKDTNNNRRPIMNLLSVKDIREGDVIIHDKNIKKEIEEVRLEDVTSSKPIMVLEIRLDDCKYPIYKII